MSESNNYCVIMAGGVGSRFWPMSTQKYPKQFQDILGTGHTMIQQTYNRISKIVIPENIYVITSKEYIALTEQQLPELNPENIVGEPMMKNTAACNMYMAKKIADKNPNANIIVLPADHLILNETVFLQKIELALNLAATKNFLITLGIKPTRPETGYGYIQFEENKDKEYFKVKTFTEKPDLEFARTFLESGDFLWNAGIFIWNVQSILSAFEEYLSEMSQHFQSCDYNTKEEEGCIDAIYPKVAKISIDNGILEKAKNVYVIPADIGWSDLGTWTSVYENAVKDAEKNASKSRHLLTYNAKGNIINLKNKNKAVIIDGLKDYIIVDTDKALLICPRANDQLIKEYVQDLKTLKKGDSFL
ncbi:mannose-1-phosphate guanylyltransferase [Kaistella solincola]|uniref:Mannose-1-phosphate guanylyltransferase n=1 Tax=Kaistella solincola TaxID=510955 RepID=A0ABR4ZUJ3_9FLAO|nr:mannose-1-phosphate guanylyltransferase [Kaistella solincola]KIA84635.1 mannose-1-phosphate guanylyltransferase [Kaistella solincola]